MTAGNLPHFIGIGAPRCGTRWLSQCLVEHPEVGIPTEEVYFFSTRRMVHSYWSKGLDWYASFLRTGITPQSKVWGEITPFYLYDEDSAQLIYQTVPDVKLICCVRDQFERAYSWYTLFLRYNPSLIHSEFSFRQFLTYCADVYGREGFYLEHINRFLEFFPRESILFLVYDDLVADPKAYIQRVFEFLAVDATYVPPAVERHINFLRIPKQRIWEDIADKFARRGYSKIENWIRDRNSVPVAREHLPARHRPSAELRARMYTMFAEHNIQLGRFLGRDLTHWNMGSDAQTQN